MSKHPDILRALAFATAAHEGQTRAGGEPYIQHCIRVSEAAALLAPDPAIAMAALLHDTIEDCDVTAEDIAAEFGPRVAGIVVELTDVYGPREGWNRARRKEAEAVRLAGCSWEARMIKLCDVADNARSIEAKGGKFAVTWRAEKASLVQKLLGA